MTRMIFLYMLVAGSLIALVGILDPEASADIDVDFHKIQMLVLVIMWAVMLLEIVPGWLSRLNSTKLKGAGLFISISIAMVMMFIMIPEVQEASVSEQRIMGTCMAIAILAVYFVIKYFYSRRLEKSAGFKDA